MGVHVLSVVHNSFQGTSLSAGSCGRVISGASGMNQRVRGVNFLPVEQQGELVQEALQ